MDNLDTISYLASTEGHKLKIHNEINTINKNIPFFHLEKNNDGFYDIKMFNYEKHDNADRMVFFSKYLTDRVLRLVDKSYDLTGYYNIELHDTYSYLNNGVDYSNCLVWSKNVKDHHTILMPDLYHLIDFGGKLKDKDVISWESKTDAVGFYGSTTGSRNPTTNQRIKTCMWARDHRHFTDFHITNIVQMDPQVVFNKVPDIQQVLTHPVHHTALYKYKFLLDIPGNTCSWDRVPLVLNSNSLLFKMPCDDVCFYYPLMHQKEHFISVNHHNMFANFMYHKNNPFESKEIVKRANSFVENYLKPQHALMYLVYLFEQAGYEHGK